MTWFVHISRPHVRPPGGHIVQSIAVLAVYTTLQRSAFAFVGRSGRAHGTTGAALSDTQCNFSGAGTLSANSMAIDIGPTSCTSPDHDVAGTHTIDKQDATSLQASGQFSTIFGGRPARCAGTSLKKIPFCVVGSVDPHSGLPPRFRSPRTAWTTGLPRPMPRVHMTAAPRRRTS